MLSSTATRYDTDTRYQYQVLIPGTDTRYPYLYEKNRYEPGIGSVWEIWGISVSVQYRYEGYRYRQPVIIPGFYCNICIIYLYDIGIIPIYWYLVSVTVWEVWGISVSVYRYRSNSILNTRKLNLKTRFDNQYFNVCSLLMFCNLMYIKIQTCIS